MVSPIKHDRGKKTSVADSLNYPAAVLAPTTTFQAPQRVPTGLFPVGMQRLQRNVSL